MGIGAIGAMLAVLAVVFLLGRVWFALVEGVLSGLRRLPGRSKPGAWHPLPPEEKQEEIGKD